MDLSLRNVSLDPVIIDVLHELLDVSEETEKPVIQAPSRTYVREERAMAATPSDVQELPNAYVYVIDMPGLKRDQINVYVEDNTLIVGGERKREKEKDRGVRYIKMERRLGKYLKKFELPENADQEKIWAMYQDGVLTVTVEKKPPPEPKKHKTIEVQVA